MTTKEININKSKFNLSDVVKVDKPKEAEEPEKKEPLEDVEINENKIEQPKTDDKPPAIERPPIKPYFRPEKLSQEDEEKKRGLIQVLQGYKNSQFFGKYLSERGFNLNATELKRLSVEQLNELINDVKFCVFKKNSGNMLHKMSTEGVLALERALQKFYNCDGLATCLSRDPAYNECVEEMILDSQPNIYIKPHLRWGYMVLTGVYWRHQAIIDQEKQKNNPNPQQNNINLQKPINPVPLSKDIENKINDLVK